MDDPLANKPMLNSIILILIFLLKVHFILTCLFWHFRLASSQRFKSTFEHLMGLARANIRPNFIFCNYCMGFKLEQVFLAWKTILEDEFQLNSYCMRLENPRLLTLISLYLTPVWAGAPGSHGDRKVQPVAWTFTTEPSYQTFRTSPRLRLELKLKTIKRHNLSEQQTFELIPVL